MITALLLLALCQPVPSCVDNGNVSPCATPTPVLVWDRVPDTQSSIVTGYKLYYRYPGGTPQLLVDLPCWPDDDGRLYCYGPDLPYPVPRRSPEELATVEYLVKASSLTGMISLDYSNAVSICLPAICKNTAASHGGLCS